MSSTVVKTADRPKPPNAGKGRVKGVPNKTTASIKGAFVEAFEKMGGSDALHLWGVENPTEFYKLASKLIPTEVNSTVAATVAMRKAEEMTDDELASAVING